MGKIIAAIRHIARRGKLLLYHLNRNFRIIKKSGLFDVVYYCNQDPQIIGTRNDMIYHYIKRGAEEHRDPHVLFDTSFYIEQNPDVVNADINPLYHYITFGAKEGRNPHVLFDTSFYYEQNPDVLEAGINPLIHYILHGADEGRDPNPIFDTSYYTKHNVQEIESGINPLAHYILRGAAQGKNPSMRYDTSQYKKLHSDVVLSRINPLVHLIQHLESDTTSVENVNDQKKKPEPGPVDFHPLISILMFDCPYDAGFVDVAIKSIISQVYQRWELCVTVIDGGGDDSEIIRTLNSYSKHDDRIRVYVHNKKKIPTSMANAALEMAKGEFIAFFNCNDELLPNAIIEVTRTIEAHPDVDVLYTDEAFIDVEGNILHSYYKPDWSPEFLRGIMYIGKLLVIRSNLLHEIGGFDDKYSKVQEYDLMLRLSEKAKHIFHVSKVLYRRRRDSGNITCISQFRSNSYSMQAANAVNEHLKRCSVPAIAIVNPDHENRIMLRPIKRIDWPLVSIIVYSPDALYILEDCLQSIRAKTTYKNYEIIVVMNKQGDSALSDRMRRHPFQVIPYPENESQNYSRAINHGVENAKGDYIILFNPSLYIISRNWIEEMLFYLEMPKVGCVGALLLNPNDTVKHAGLAISKNGKAIPVMQGIDYHSDGYWGTLSCTREVTAVTSDCMMIPNNLYQKVGGLREHFVNGYQDIDLSLRLISYGQRILYTPMAILRFRKYSEQFESDDLLDRALFDDVWHEIIKHGDQYFNPNQNV